MSASTRLAPGAGRLALVLAMVMALTGCAAGSGPLAGAGSAALPAERQIIVAVQNHPPRVQRRAGSTARLYAGAAGYRSSPSAVARTTALARRYGLREVDRWPIEALSLHCVVLEVPPGQSRDEVLAALASEPDVELAQPVHAFTSLQPGPSPSPDAGDVHRVPAGGVATGSQIPAADGIGRAHRWATGRGVTVAVIDTGMDDAHPALGGRVRERLDFVGRQRFAFAEERHGLAVAGVIAAGANERLHTVGVAPDARLLAARACWHVDEDTAVCNSFTLARALGAVLQRDVGVINMSLHGPHDPLLERLLAVALARGVIAVGALPDEGEATGFPATVPGVLPVRSLEAAEQVADGVDSRILRAPGRAVLTLQPGGGYRYSHGSSLAAAHVSGVVALLLEQRNGMGSDEVRDLLSAHARVVERDGVRVAGVVDACLALAALLGDDCVEPAMSGDNGPARPPPAAGPAIADVAPATDGARLARLEAYLQLHRSRRVP